jgi:hypothetical protein
MMAATLDTLTPTVAQDQTVDQNQQDVITNSVLNKENGGVNEDENNDPRDNGNPDPSAHNSESEEDTESSQKV